MFSSKFTKNRFYKSGQWFKVTFFANKFSKTIPLKNNTTYINNMYKFLQDCYNKKESVTVGKTPSFKFYETENCNSNKDIQKSYAKSLNKK